MIHFISSCDRIGLSILTSLALHGCLGTSAPSLAQASPSHAVPRFKASDLPFTLATGPSSQASSWSSPPWSHDSISCLICNELLYHHIITCGLVSCVSHINTISPPKLSLNYQNQTRIFQPCRPAGRGNGPSTACCVPWASTGTFANWAVPCSGQAVTPCFGPCLKPTGCMLKFTQDPARTSSKRDR